MLNHITIMGRLARDPELRRTSSGVVVTSFTLAVDRDYMPKNGGQRETDWVNCVAWRNTGEFVSKYFTKGRMAVVSGRLQVRSWTDKDGSKRRTTEVIAESVYFGDSKRETSPAPSYEAAADNSAQSQPYGAYPVPAPDYEGHEYYSDYEENEDFDMPTGDDGQIPF